RIGDVQIPDDAGFQGEYCLHGSALLDAPDGPAPAASLRDKQSLLVFEADSRAVVSQSATLELSRPSEERLFVEIVLVSGPKILLTPEHGVYSSQCGPGLPFRLVSAAQLTPRSCLPKVHSAGVKDEQVQSTRLVSERGVFRPVTNAGTLLIHRIIISCFDSKDHRALNILPHVDSTLAES
ncbi:MAG: hypothetical protein AAF269_11910, partial [Pseudomonadota bacterium]